MDTPSLAAGPWRTSSYSGENGSCVQVTMNDRWVGVRDSKNTGAGYLTLSAEEWKTFLAAVETGRVS